MPVIPRSATALLSATTRVAVNSATAPTAGQVLTATSTTAATWQSATSARLFDNAVINAGFDIWQQTTSSAPNDDTYVADVWNFLTETNGAWTVAQDTDVPSDGSAKYSMKFSNVTLNNQCAIVQFIENVEAIKLFGRTVSLSFDAKTSGTEIGNLRATVLAWSSTADTVTSDVIGTWASDGTDPTWATNWTSEKAGSNLALTSSWQRFKIEGIALDTASTTNLAVVIWVDDGTIAANDDFWITKAKLNDGATALPYMPRSKTEEFLHVLRHLYVPGYEGPLAGNKKIGFGVSYSTTGAIMLMKMPVAMRTEPTLIATATDWSLLLPSTARYDVTSMTKESDGWNDTVGLDVSVASGLTADKQYFIETDATSGRKMAFDARL